MRLLLFTADFCDYNDIKKQLCAKGWFYNFLK